MSPVRSRSKISLAAMVGRVGLPLATLLLLCLFPTLLRGGELTKRFELTLDRVLQGGPPRYDERFLLADVVPENIRRFTNFSGDLSGRYLGALAAAGTLSSEDRSRLDQLLLRLLEHQKPDGHFGAPMSRSQVVDDDMARLWGNGRLLIGLLEYYQRHPLPEVLEAARRLGDFLVAAAPTFNAKAVERHYTAGRFAVGYICWTQNIEGLVELHRETSEERYLDLAREMAARTARHPSQHSHGLLSSLRGILQLAEATGDAAYLRQVEREWQGIVESGNLLVHGAIPEAFAPSIERDEGCSQADWLRLNLGLWRATGDVRYLEHAEGTLFNEFFMNQFPSGDFGHFAISPDGLGHGSARAWWCCTLHGLRAFPAVFEAVFRSEDGTLHNDLPLDGEGSLEGLEIRARSSLETDGVSRLLVTKADGASHTLAIRVPNWAERVVVSVGGKEQTESPQDGYIRLDQPWQEGDSITVQYDFHTRLVPDDRRSGRVAVFCGPWLLAVAEESSPHFFDEPHQHNRVVLPSSGAGGTFELPGAAASDTGIPAFTVPVGRRHLEWIPAGYPSQRQTALLRPIAEHTSTASSARWQFWFRTESAAASDAQDVPASDGLNPITAALLAGLLALVVLGYVRRRRSAKQ